MIVLIACQLICQSSFRQRFEAAAPGIERQAVLQEWMRAELDNAAAYLREWNGGSERASLLWILIEYWARKDAPKAADYVATIRLADAGALVPPLLLEWTKQNPQAAVNWANRLPECPGPGDISIISMAGHISLLGTRLCREDALEAAGFGWSCVDPKAAAAWAKTIRSDELRRRVVDKIAQSQRYR